MFFDLEKAQSWTLIFIIIGILTTIIGVLGFFIIKEPKVEPVKDSYLGGIIYGFRPKTIASNPRLYISLLAFIIFNISIQIFMPYLIIYYEVSLGMKDYVLIMAPAIILASVVTALWGKVYDKKGFSFSGLFAILFLIAGYVVLYLTRTTAPVFIGSLLMMSGYLSGMAVFGAAIRDNTPVGFSGRLQGVRIFSQVLVPGVVGPAIGKKVLENAEVIVNNDGTTSFVPNANIFLAALIAVVLVLPFFIVRKNKKA
jgi:MFS family permease